MITLKEVTKSYGDITPINNINLQIDSGEFVSIIGPSGSGKTTLLNIIAGLLTKIQGEVIIDGITLNTLNQRELIDYRRKNFGFVFQSFNLIPYLSSIENVKVPLYLTGTKKKRQDNIAKELLEKVGLKNRCNSFPAQLSMGEKQRVAIARALSNNPRVIFADEPTGNLDTKTGQEVMNCMKELNDMGVTVLLVTHDLAVAGFSSRTLKLSDGRFSNEKK